MIFRLQPLETSGKSTFIMLRKNASRVRYNYALGDLVYVDKTGIFRRIDYKNHGRYIINKVFTNGIVRVQMDQVNEHISIQQIYP